MKVELYVLPIAAFHEKLHFSVVRHASSGELTFPTRELNNELHVAKATAMLLREYFSFDNDGEFESWASSTRCNARIINVFDRDLLPQQEKSIAIVKAVPIPENIALRNLDNWYTSPSLLSDTSHLSVDNQIFLKEALNQIPIWVKNTSFTFELLSQVFSIQDLRLLVSMLSNQEIDPGNFHRRLKKLDILRPRGTSQQRVHKWEFAWERSPTLSADGLIP